MSDDATGTNQIIMNGLLTTIAQHLSNGTFGATSGLSTTTNPPIVPAFDPETGFNQITTNALFASIAAYLGVS